MDTSSVTDRLPATDFIPISIEHTPEIPHEEEIDAVSKAQLKLLTDLPTLSLKPSDTKQWISYRPNVQQFAHPTMPRKLPADEPQVKDDQQLFETLADAGYLPLATSLRKETGQILQKIKSAPSPVLMEQLLDLYTLAQAKKYDTQKLMDFCLEVACPPNVSFSLKTPLDARNAILGKILFLVDRDGNKAVSFLDMKAFEASSKAVDVLINQELTSIAQRLAQHEINHKRARIQDSSQAYATLLPLEFANLLITNSGTFNIGMVSVVREKFLPLEKSKIAFEEQMSYVLKSFEDSRQLRSMISSLVVPSSPAAPANHLIRITLGKSHNQPITDGDVKRTALTGLLAHLRQGPVSSCFATYIAIEMLSSRIDRCIADFRELLKESKLTRKVNGNIIEFPFLMKVNSGVMEKAIKIQKTGYLDINTPVPCPLWKAPTIVAACSAIGIKNMEGIIRAILPELIPPSQVAKSSSIPITTLLQFIIKEACKSDLKDNKEGVAVLLGRAVLAIEAQTHNLLQRMWENAIANTAEARDCGLLKHSLLNAIVQPIKTYAQAIPTALGAFLDTFLASVTKVLQERIQLLYDPNVKYSEIGSDSHSSEGAFVLLDRVNSNNPATWKLIDSPVSFQNFVVSVVCQAYNFSAKTETTGTLLSPSQIQLPNLMNYLNGKSFLQNALHTYNSANQSNADLAARLGVLKHAPWLDKIGNDPIEVLQIYLETNSSKFTQLTSSPGNAEELLKDIIQFGKRIDGTTRVSTSDNIYKRVPLFVHGVHACSLMLGHPSFQKAWSSKEEESKWMQENIIKPGLTISKGAVTTETRHQMIAFLYPRIATEHQAAFNSEANAIASPMSVQAFRNKLLSLSKARLKKERSDEEELSHDFDAYLFTKGLPEAMRKTLRDNILHFADTNWERGVQDTHFCFIFNPGTASVELWEAMENGAELFYLKPDRWITGQKWICIPEPMKS